MRYRWFVDKDRQTDEYGVPVSRAAYDEELHPPKKKIYRRGEVLAILVVLFVLLYEWNEDYSPVLYMCVSFLTFEARPVVKFFLGEKSKAIINALSGFSIAMFIAAVIWAAL